MFKPNFKKYSLILVKGNKIIFSSNKSGLSPLVECVREYRGKLEGCVLYDRVIGLAAARLIVYSKIIFKVVSRVSSKAAKNLLDGNKIELIAANIVDNILTKNRSNICPMELKAKKMNNKIFYLNLIKK